MRKISALAASAVTAVALAAPAAGVISPAQAATVGSAVTTSTAVAPAAVRTRIKLSTNKKGNGTHVGLPGAIVTAKVFVGGRKAKGKVKFTVGSINLGKVKLKRGKASVQLPQTLPAGTYKVKAKYKTTAKKIKTYVWNSSLSLNASTFTISKATESYKLPALTGTVIFKGVPASKGWVDIYQDGINTLGSKDPHYVTMTGVDPGGAFDFYGSQFLGAVQKKAPGTYNFKAFYTDDPAFADYIYSTWITVTVTP